MSLGICSFSSSLLECLMMLKRIGFNLSRCCMAGKLGSFFLRSNYQVREAMARNWATVETWEFRPPSTVTTWPVKYELSSEAR